MCRLAQICAHTNEDTWSESEKAALANTSALSDVVLKSLCHQCGEAGVANTGTFFCFQGFKKI